MILNWLQIVVMNIQIVQQTNLIVLMNAVEMQKLICVAYVIVILQMMDLKICAEYAIMMLPMTVFRIVLVIGVVI